MKINIEQITPSFLKQLEQDGFPAQAIIASLSPEDSYKEAVKKIRVQTKYSRETIKQAFDLRVKEIDFMTGGGCKDLWNLEARPVYTLRK